MMPNETASAERRGAFAAVVGGFNVDIGGRAFGPLISGDSNPGRVSVSLGGVGRNIAHNLSLLGVETCFLTACGDDLYADRFVDSCRELKIGIDDVLRISGAATSVYLYLSDADGDMALAVSDMEVCDWITPMYLSSRLSLLRNAGLVIMDANIPEETVAWLARCGTAPLFADPVSTRKAAKLRPVLNRIHTLKPNQLEAELLSGVSIRDERDCVTAVRALLQEGVGRVFLSMGPEGVLAADGRELLRVPGCPAEVRSSTGAGDAFTAALAVAFLGGLSLADTCLFATAAAALAVESNDTVNSALSADAVRKRMDLASLPVIPLAFP